MSLYTASKIIQRREGATGFIYVFNFPVTLGAGASQDLLIRTPATGPTIYAQRYTTAAAQTINSVFEGPTVTADGTPGTFLSVDRTGTRVAQSLIFDTPTVTADGLQLDNEINSLGVKLQRENVWFKLAAGTDYLIRSTSSPAGNDVVLSVRISEESE